MGNSQKLPIEETRASILESDEFVLEETKRIQYLYTLKHELRYNRVRTQTGPAESVAEHLYGMHIIANYFLPLEDGDDTLNRADVFNTINWHDADEIETGDMLGQLKTSADRAREADAIQVILGKLPNHMQTETRRLLTNYEDQSTPEAKFVKAIDKVECLFEVYDEGYKQVFTENQTILEHHQKTKVPYIGDYPYMIRFYEVITRNMIEEGYFIDTR